MGGGELAVGQAKPDGPEFDGQRARTYHENMNTDLQSRDGVRLFTTSCMWPKDDSRRTRFLITPDSIQKRPGAVLA